MRRRRLHSAAARLRTTVDTILRIASDVGYESEAAFNRAFKIEFGLPPAQYPNTYRALRNAYLRMTRGRRKLAKVAN
ncbi:MAG: helix-turn-helix domain-containing protein [Bradyrhizobium sp.]|nr:MAG: helix-turn-helix domain-containing protein [Bradyrhizobium sp.]